MLAAHYGAGVRTLDFTSPARIAAGEVVLANALYPRRGGHGEARL